MAANPRQTPHPQPRLTMPLAPGSCPLSDDTEMQVRNLCWRCHGEGSIDDIGYVRCDACGKASALDRVENHGHGHHEIWVLPCGHEQQSSALAVRYQPCPTCGGDKYLYRWTTFRAWLDWIDEQYATISQAITARQRIP